MPNSFARWIEQQWQCIGPWHALLMPLSWLFLLLSTIRRLAYFFGVLRSLRLNVPVIVVGNISVGGTGKTPLVIWLVEQLKLAGFSPGIVSRGYGSCNRLPVAVDAKSTAQSAGDEPLLLARRTGCPVWIGTNRSAAAQALMRANPQCDLIISDDGLQHYRLQRDIELAVVDAVRGFGNGQLLPAGPLREPVSRLSKVDAVIYNGKQGNCAGYVMRLQSGLFRNLKRPQKAIGAEAFSGSNVFAVAGIGNPQRFFNQLRAMGLNIEARAFPDHFAFRPADMAFAGDGVLLMTEKDAVKCSAFAGPDWWYLPVDAVVDHALADYIIQKLRKSNG
jgi:tetraacyldisaccharide 4'-kinase